MTANTSNTLCTCRKRLYKNPWHGQGLRVLEVELNQELKPSDPCLSVFPTFSPNLICCLFSQSNFEKMSPFFKISLCALFHMSLVSWKSIMNECGICSSNLIKKSPTVCGSGSTQRWGPMYKVSHCVSRGLRPNWILGSFSHDHWLV